MNNNNQNIENLFKSGLGNHTVSPSAGLWNKINKKLMFKNFFKFNPSKFNVYYAAIIGVIISAIIFYPENNEQISEKYDFNKNKKTALSENIDKKERTVSNANLIFKNEVDYKKENKKTKKLTKNNIEKENTQISNLTTDVAVNESLTNLEQNDEVIQNVESALKPVADFSASISAACVPVAVQFTNASENCNSYLWNFGNGESSSEPNPNFVFNTAGEFTVTLTVKSGSNFSSVSKIITIYPKPKSEFIISEKDNAFENDEIKFVNLSSSISSCKWNFGDNNTSTSLNPVHKYYNPGFYDVSLICFSENKCSDTSIFKNFQIKEIDYKINAPTGFAPDMSGANSGYVQKGAFSNNVFSPVFNSEVAEYKLVIFNRYGIVFESNNPELGWNGYHNNKLSAEGVYIWKCTGKFADGEVFTKTGNLTLLYKETQ